MLSKSKTLGFAESKITQEKRLTGEVNPLLKERHKGRNSERLNGGSLSRTNVGTPCPKS